MGNLNIVPAVGGQIRGVNATLAPAYTFLAFVAAVAVA
jgi:hypothetical protein